MNIEIKAGEDGKITTAGKLDIDTPNTHMNNIDVTGKALVSQMVNTPMVQAGNVNGTAAGAFWPNPGAYSNDWVGMVQVHQLLLLQHKMLTMLKRLKEYQNTNLGKDTKVLILHCIQLIKQMWQKMQKLCYH